MELIVILQALQEAENQPLLEKMERDRLKEVALNCKGVRGGRGSFEDKIINGCGPYSPTLKD